MGQVGEHTTDTAGWVVMHQYFRIDRARWRSLPAEARAEAIDEFQARLRQCCGEEGLQFVPLAGIAKSDFVGHVAERPVSVVAEKNISPVIQHDQVREAVVIVIANRCTHAEIRIADPGSERDIRKCSVADVSDQAVGVTRIAGLRRQPAPLRKVDVGPTVEIVIENGNPASHRLQDVFGAALTELWESAEVVLLESLESPQVAAST